MSVVFSLTAVGVAMGITAISGSLSVIAAFSQHRCGEKEIDPVETRFSDSALLEQTLTDHGFAVNRNEQGDLVVNTNVGSLRFYYSEQSGSYWVKAYNLVNEEALATELGNINDEYMLNVQKCNYTTLKKQLAESDTMRLAEEEVLEDDTILLTIDLM